MDVGDDADDAAGGGGASPRAAAPVAAGLGFADVLNAADRESDDREPDDHMGETGGEVALLTQPDDSPLLRAAITVRPPGEGDGDAGPLDAGPLDAGPLDAGPLDAGPLDAGHPEFQSIVRQSVVDQVRVHADKNPGIEVCGVLVGTVYENPQASFVYIDGLIRGDGSSGRSTQVTFTAETWQHVHRAMEEQYPGKRIIGWYHTHPGFGIFLSEMDLFIQRHFFNAAWQVAFVLDPKSGESGMFAWRAGQVRRVEFVLDDESTAGGPEAMFASLPTLGGPSVSAPATFEEEPGAPVDRATLEALADRLRVLESRVAWLLTGFAILAVAAIIWPLVVLVAVPANGAGNPAAPADRPVSGTGRSPDPVPADDDPLLPLK